jgi:uncharacterized protein YacL
MHRVQGGKEMNSSSIKWIMDVLRKNVYVQLVVAMIGFLGAIVASVILKGTQEVGFYFLFGLCTGLIGVASCYLSGVAYDKMNARLHTAENEERKEKLKEEKRARKSKTH